MADPWLLVLGCAAATYAWRGLGVLLADRIRVDGEAFVWITCVAYAMVAGLIARIIVIPSGMLAESALSDRLIACVVTVLIYRLGGRKLFVALGAGVTVLVALGYGRGLG